MPKVKEKDRRSSVKEKKPQKRVSLKVLAEHLGLSQATVSIALNPAAASGGIATSTRERVKQAAREFNYQPSYLAQSLSRGRSFTVAVLVPEIGDGYYSSLISGIEEELLRQKYYYIVGSHRWDSTLLETLPDAFIRRGAEGIIIINTQFDEKLSVPVVTICSRTSAVSLTDVQLDETRGTQLAVEHLASLNHRKIAFFHGDVDSTATEARWSGIQAATAALHLPIDSRLVMQLQRRVEAHTPTDMSEGYACAKALLATKIDFTALFAYNDISAIGAVRAFQDAGLRVPEDISVMGYDDIPAASFERPPLTTIRQPLITMGHRAAAALLEDIANPKSATKNILVEPTLIVRGTTAVARHPEAIITGSKASSLRRRTVTA